MWNDSNALSELLMELSKAIACGNGGETEEVENHRDQWLVDAKELFHINPYHQSNFIVFRWPS